MEQTLTTDTNYKPEFIDEAEKKIKELNQALDLVNELEERLSWAQDFTNYTIIRNAMESPIQSIDEARDTIEQEIDALEYEMEQYHEKLDFFNLENKIVVNQD